MLTLFLRSPERSQHRSHEIAPCVAGWVRLGRFPRRFRDVASPAQSLKIARIVGVTAVAQRLDVIAFEPAGPAALDTPPAVALEDSESDSGPAP